MKKFTFFFALFAMLFLNVGIAMGETATLAYTGETTTNMTGNNDAALVGLDASQWTVVGDKGSTSNNVGLNKAGNIRLYAHKDSGNGNILTVSISAGTIDEITLDIKQIATYEVTAAGKVVEATGEATYAIGASSFSIQNKTTGETTQLHLNSISINYTSTGEGGENPETPEEPETPETPEEPENPEEPVVGGIDGYTKVTNVASLVAGDKVVLYCDDAAVGVTGWNGNKDATVAETGWVEYVVEVADGGFYLKDGEQYITGAESANHFKYGEKAVCGVSDAGVLACGTKFLYKNGDYYRMYTDKSSNSAYKPFYVYKAGAGSGETPEEPEEPENPNQGEVVELGDLAYANAYYYAEEGVYEIALYNVDETEENIEYPYVLFGIFANSKTSLNGSYDVVAAAYVTGEGEEDLVYNNEDVATTLSIKNVDNEGNYSFVGSFVGLDGKTYQVNTISNVWAQDDATGEDIELNEEGGSTPDDDDPVTPPADGSVTFDADVDKGNASEDTSNQTPYSVSKDGITMAVTKGVISKYNNECHYRVYKNETLTLTSTVGNIVAVEFTCTANDAAQYGPGCLTASTGDYTYSGPVGTWTGNAASVVFTASTAQVRATQIVVKIAGGATGVEDVTTVVIPVKVMQNGQLMIIRGEKTYNVMGAEL